MTKKKYQRYSSEFKSLALRRASEDGVTDKEVCEDLGVFATFGGTEFDRLMCLFRRVLKKGGHLVNVSWDGTYYTEKEKI